MDSSDRKSLECVFNACVRIAYGQKKSVSDYKDKGVGCDMMRHLDVSWSESQESAGVSVRISKEFSKIGPGWNVCIKNVSRRQNRTLAKIFFNSAKAILKLEYFCYIMTKVRHEEKTKTSPSESAFYWFSDLKLTKIFRL